MKKTVIKRRKRVPAAGPGLQMPIAPSAPGASAGGPGGQPHAHSHSHHHPGPMTEQAAAETLVSVGRGTQQDHLSTGDDSDDDPASSSRSRKRQRRSESAGEHFGMVDYDERGRNHRSRREEWQDETNFGTGAASSYPAVESGGGGRTSTTGYYNSPALGQGGYDLPPLNAALGSSGEKMGSRYGTNNNSNSNNSNYASTGLYSRAEGGGGPSRTHSPAMGLHLPPPHGISLFNNSGSSGINHGQSRTMSPRAGSPLREGNNGMSYGISNFGVSSTSGLGMSSSMGVSSSIGNTQVPTISELESHYRKLEMERERLRDMLEKTDRMMSGVKRGIEEMMEMGRNSGAGSGAGTSLGAGDSGINSSSGMGASTTTAGSGTSSIPLPSSRGERREGINSTVWSVESDVSRRD